MAEKKSVNKLIIVIVATVVFLFIVFFMANKDEQYQAVTELPRYQQDSQPQDGDTQADTIRALQAYAKEAVGKAEKLNDSTSNHVTQVLENRNKVQRLEKHNKAVEETNTALVLQAQRLERELRRVEAAVEDLKKTPPRRPKRRSDGSTVNNSHSTEDLPVGFGFDGLELPINPNQGTWHDPIDRSSTNEGKGMGKGDDGFSGLLSPPGQRSASDQSGLDQSKSEWEESALEPSEFGRAGDGAQRAGQLESVNPAYTIAKDSILFDGTALTALIGRIPVEGSTPDPYPVKIFVGKENLAANGHQLPDIEGMIFSGLGLGDWNMSCVSARLTSATYIFSDGRIVNHSSETEPLAYISDRHGWPCVSGVFRTNARSFLRQRISLASLGAAGAAYSDAQLSQESSGLTGTTTRSLTGQMEKAVLGTAVQSATDEISQWLLERQKQSFDAVVVEPGAKVSIHMLETLTIDRLPDARRVRFSDTANTAIGTLD